jgi:hypothetical protein
VNNDNVWCIVKTTNDVSDDCVKNRILKEKNVIEVYSVIETRNSDYDLDITI